MPPRRHRAEPRRRRRRAPRDNLRTMVQPLRAGAQAVGSFPSRAIIPLRYSSYARVSPGVLTGSDNTYSLNSVYDPDVTGAGHQPREFDTWATLYGRYRVHYVDVECWVRQRAAHGIHVWLIPSNTPTAYATADRPAELPRAITLGTTGSNQPLAHRKVRIDNPAVLGQTRAQYLASEDTSAVVTASPAEQTYLHIWAQQIDAVTVCDFEYEITLTYMVEFFDRVYVGPSALLSHAASVVRNADGVVVPNPAPAPSALPPPPLRPPVPPPGLMRYLTGI